MESNRDPTKKVARHSPPHTPHIDSQRSPLYTCTSYHALMIRTVACLYPASCRGDSRSAHAVAAALTPESRATNVANHSRRRGATALVKLWVST